MKKGKLYYFLLICLVIITVSLIEKTFENDTFFTIPTGDYILQNGIDEVEPFTWHENLKFIKLRWGFDIVVYKIYETAGFTGLYIFTVMLSVIIAIALFTALNKRGNNKIISFLVALYTIICVSDCLTCRAQITSYLFFILEMYSIEMLMETGKKRYCIYLVLISFAILCFHSSVWLVYFIFFIPYIVEWLLNKLKIVNLLERTDKILIEKVDNKKIKLLLITMVVGMISGLCTPLGLSPYTYMTKVMSGVSSQIIDELETVLIEETYELYFICIAAIIILGLTKTKIRIVDIFFIVGFLIMSKLARRNIYIAIPLLAYPMARIITTFINTYDKTEIFNKIEDTITKGKGIKMVIFLACILVSIINYRQIYRQPYVDETEYPVQAAEYIKNNIDLETARIYNHFNFGSYLELQGIPTFIDSRSEVYCKEFSNVDILEDFAKFDIWSEMDIEEIAEKYGITHFLVGSRSYYATYLNNDDENYELIYSDNDFSIYEVIDD